MPTAGESVKWTHHNVRESVRVVAHGATQRTISVVVAECRRFPFAVPAYYGAGMLIDSFFDPGPNPYYGSTPAYRPVLELHGWGDLQTELNSLSKQGRWADMAHIIDDDVISAFAVVAEPDQVATAVRDRYGDIGDRVSLYFGLAREVSERIATGLRSM